MATHINFYLNNTKINPPRNWQEISIELNFDKNALGAEKRVTITDWEFVRENNDIIHKWITDGLTTGVGVFEGIPFRIEVERKGKPIEIPFDGYLDLSDGLVSSRTFSKVKSVENYSVDWLNDVADGFSLEYLYKETSFLHQSDVISMPYILNSVPNYIEAAVSVLSVYVLVKEIKDAIQKIAEFVADMPVFYVFSSYIKLILYILYLIILIVALIKLIKQMFLLIIQPVKYHNCMSLKRQLEAGANYLGLTLRAPDLDIHPYDKLTHLPAKFYNPINTKEKQILGFTEPKIEQKAYYDGTYGQLLRDYKQFINGKIIIKGTELWIVRRDYNISAPQFTLKPIYNRDFRLNTNEFKSNMLISFQTDFSEKNTIQEYQGTSQQTILTPARINNPNMVLMKGLEEIRLPWALAKRKETLTVPEEIFDAFLKGFGSVLGALVNAANAVIDVLNTVISKINDVIDKLGTIGIKLNFNLPDIPSLNMPNFSDNISNRIGMLKIEKDSFNVPKLFLITIGNAPKKNKIHENNATLVTAGNLFNNYYVIDTFLLSNSAPNGNQYYLKEVQNHPFLFNDYVNIKENNIIFTPEGDEALIDSLKWFIFKQTADINFRINKAYTNNLIATYYEPDGS